MPRRAFLLAVLLLGAAAGAQLVRGWRAVSTEHFELVSRYDPARTGPLLTDLEWERGVFEVNFGLKSRLDRRALLLIPDSPAEFEQMSPSQFADGYYAGVPWRDIIVLRDLANARRSLFHEYTHLVLNHEGGRWPAWFNEGSAEYYATMRRDKDGATAGIAETGAVETLRQEVWLPISYFTRLERTIELPSADANRRFYAQAWLYVHMLHLSPAYRDRFAIFRTLLSDGTSTEEALERAYAKSPIKFDDDARAWLRQARVTTERLRPPSTSGAKVETKVMADVEVEIARATVAASIGPNSQAASDYSRLVALAGERCGLQASLGDLAFAAHKFPQASVHYRAAVECGAGASGLAQGLEVAMSYRPDVSMAEIESLEKETGGNRSPYLVGTGRFFAGDYEGALKAFQGASGLPQTDDFRMTRLQALSLARLKRFGEAQTAAEKLKGIARDSGQRRSAELTVEDVQRERKSAETPPETYARTILRSLKRLDGEVIRVDCLDSRARFWIRSGAATLKLLVADPRDVTSGNEGGKPLEFGCGAQRWPVTVGYQEQSDPTTDTTGRIRYLEFR